jgi:hypothetical protein
MFGTGFILLLLAADGTVTDAVRLSAPPIACAVDGGGRAHILTQESVGWALSILDPRVDEGIPICLIPYGEPAMVSPHRIACGRDGSVYWDDLIPSDSGGRWGIARLTPGSAGGIFALAGAEPSLSWVYEETTTDSLRIATSIACGGESDLWIGVQDFPWDASTQSTGTEAEEAHSASLLRVDKSGNLLRHQTIPTSLGAGALACDLHTVPDGMLSVFAGAESGIPVGAFSPDGVWTTVSGFPLGNPIAKARIAEIQGGFLGWFLQPGYETDETHWFRIGPRLDRFERLDRLDAIACRLLDANDGGSAIYVTIDDGEVFQIDISRMLVTGIWTNRLPGGAPGHPLDDAAWRLDELAVLDREHRAVISIPQEAFLAWMRRSGLCATPSRSARTAGACIRLRLRLCWTTCWTWRSWRRCGGLFWAEESITMSRRTQVIASPSGAQPRTSRLFFATQPISM